MVGKGLIHLLVSVAVACIAGCNGTVRTDGGGDGDSDVDSDSDGDSDSGEGRCEDRDRDGFGVGDGCRGDDCDDLDAALSSDCASPELCAEGIHVTGCPCTVDQVVPCYTGPEGTAGLGACMPGLRDCLDGAYQACEGQILPAEEACNGEDDDCDDQPDDGVLSACGDCNFECVEAGLGIGAETPFDDEAAGAQGIIQNPDGSITLGNTVTITNRVIWIANSGEGTVAKVDTTTNEEIGRYYTAPNQAGDPSRSTVNPRGDVVSVNRGGSSATFIMASDCPDQDNDGIVTTSDGPGTVLPWGQDECMIWNVAIAGGGARGAAIEVRAELDGTSHEYAWVGSYNAATMYEIDVELGELTGRSVNTSPANPYGAALGPNHTLWVTTSGTSMAKIDTESLAVTQYSAPPGRFMYGITVDRDGYVWTSGYGGGGAQRFDPAAEDWELVTGGCGGGIAADMDGNVWTGHGYICQPRGIARIDPETMTAEVVQTGGDTHGVAVDFDGFVWGINVSGGSAHKVDPSDNSFIEAWRANTAWNYNYTYSDMTGYQLVNATQEEARYSHVFTGCQAPDETEWANLTWDADVPGFTQLVFTGWSSPTLEGLADATPVVLASVPPAESPVDVAAAFDAAGVEMGMYLRIEIILRSTQRDSAPTVRRMAVQHSCGVPFQ